MEQRIRKALEDHLGASVALAARLDCLGGHASLRIYWRVHLPQGEESSYPRGEQTLMAMVLPEGAEVGASEEASGQGGKVKELPFLNVQRYLAALGMRVPEVDHVDMARGVVFEEDLGDHTFEARYLHITQELGPDVVAQRVPVEQLYHRAINVLVDLQRKILSAEMMVEEAPALPDCVALSRRFDAELLRWELDHYREWGLEARADATLSARRLMRFEAARDVIVESLVALPKVLVLRDFQSRNIMLKRDELYLIDFQDALIGPYIYDLVALLRDSYIQLPFVIVSRLVDHYINQGQAAGLPWCHDATAVHHAFHLQTVQRKLKDAGRFVFIERVKGNPSFLQYYDPSIFYVKQSLEELEGYDGRSEISALSELLSRVDPSFSKPAPA